MKTNNSDTEKQPYIIIKTTSDTEQWLEKELEKANKNLRQFCQDKIIELLLTGGIKRQNEIRVFMSVGDQMKILEMLLKLVDTK